MTLALITTARIGELLSLRWDQCRGDYLTFLRTKNGRARRNPISPTMKAVLSAQPKATPWGITNPRTQKPYTTVAGSFGRTVERAGITTGDVTLHTLRHTAISRMIEAGCDDFTVMASRGTPRRVCSRGTRIPRKIARLRPWSCFEWSQIGHNGPVETMHASPRQPTKRL